MAEAARQTGVSYDVIRELHRRPDSTTSIENANKIIEALALRSLEGSSANFSARDQYEPDILLSDPNDPTRTIAIEVKSYGATDASVPAYEVDASAGGGAFVDTEEHTYSLSFPPLYLRKIANGSINDLAIIGVKGDSMEPTLPDDSIVLMDTTKTHLGYDGLFVLRIDDVLHVKRVGRSGRKGYITIISDNEEVYPAFERAVEDVDAVGKVLWYGRKV